MVSIDGCRSALYRLFSAHYATLYVIHSQIRSYDASRDVRLLPQLAVLLSLGSFTLTFKGEFSLRRERRYEFALGTS